MACSWSPNEGFNILLEVIGSILVLLLWAAPIRDIWTGRESVFAKKSTEQLATGFPYVSSLFNCALWVLYALDKLDQLLVPTLVNVTGFLLNLSFCVCFYMYSEGAKKGTFKLQMSILAFIFMVGFFVLVAAGTEPVGYLAAFLNAVMLFAPLAAAGTVIRTRSTKGMPFLPLIFVLSCSVAWFLFGLNICNIPIMIPNGLGIVFGILQLSLFYWARSQELQNTDVELSLSEDFELEDTERPAPRSISSSLPAPRLSLSTPAYAPVAQDPSLETLHD